MHNIQTALQILFKTSNTMSIRLLWSWILRAPAPTTLRDRDCRTLRLTLLPRLDAHMLSKSRHLLQNHLAHLAYIFHDLEIEVEGCGAARLVGGIVPDVEVRVLEGFFDGDSG